jgi:hypothetical protein
MTNMESDGLDETIISFDKLKRKHGRHRAAQHSESSLPRLRVDSANPHETVSAMKEVLAGGGALFDRGGPVRLDHDIKTGETSARLLDAKGLIVATHLVSRPFAMKDGVEIDVGLPAQISSMYLSYHDWGLPPLSGITTAPLLSDDGSIRIARGYDAETGLFCEGIVDIAGRVPERPTKEQAKNALKALRLRFRTLPFADAIVRNEGGVSVVDPDESIGDDESGYLSQLLGAVCRPSLRLAPGLAVLGAPMSGSGAGKGLAVRAILEVAYGRQPGSIAQTTTREELDKQFSSALIEAAPSVLLDNFNDTTLTSSVLASALTECPSKVRVFQKLQLATLNALAFIAVTGNGLSLSMDIVRRFIRVELDARVEDPESRNFTSNLLMDLARDRTHALVEILTIWRWGRQAGAALKKGKPFGTYEEWSAWVRDPLVALGCKDSVRRIGETKTHDPARQRVARAFSAWWHLRGSELVTAADINPEILDEFDPPKRSRQYIAIMLAKLAGTRVGGFALEQKPTSGRWSADGYRLSRTDVKGFHRTATPDPDDFE